MNTLRSRKGNALILVVILGGLGLASLTVMLSQIGQFSKTVATAQNQAQASGQSSLVADLVYKKIQLNGKLKPDWSTQFYPVASEMTSSAPSPTLKALSPSAIASDTFVALYWVQGHKDDSGTCQAISPVPKKALSPDDCNVVNYLADGSGLGSVLSEAQSSGTNLSQVPSGLISFPNFNNLSLTELLGLFTPGAQAPLNKLLSDSGVVFKKLIADSSNPNKLAKVLFSIQSGAKSTLALFPINPPATPSCQISAISAQPIPLFTQGDYDTVFQIQTDSVTSNAKIILPDGTEANYNSFDRYAMSGYGEMKPLKPSGFTFRIPKSKGESMTGQLGVTYDPTNPRIQNWNIIARVAGLDGATTDCNMSLKVDYPLEPICTVYASQPNPVPGETIDIIADCNSPLGGPVADLSLVVNSNPGQNSGFQRGRFVEFEENRIIEGRSFTVRNRRFESTSNQPDNANNRTFSKPFVKQGTGVQTLTVTVKSITGREYPYSVVLNSQGCPFNDTNYEAKLFANNSVFKEKGDEDGRVGVAPDDLIYTMGHKTYTRTNTAANGTLYTATLTSGPASLVGFSANFTNAYAGTGAFLIKDSNELCTPGHYCMVVKRTSSAGGHNGVALGGLNALNEANTYSNIQFYWIEVGLSMPYGDNYLRTLASDINAVKRDRQCSVINTKRSMYRQGGCFAGSTTIKMADGSERKVSEISSDEWVLNPLYNVPVRVKKVVKGPEKKSLWRVNYGNQDVVVTEDHPFLTSSGWVQTQTLKAGTVLIGDRQSKKVKSVKKLNYQAPEDVWNLELDTDEDYGHLLLANGIPTGDLKTQLHLKTQVKPLP